MSGLTEKLEEGAQGLGGGGGSNEQSSMGDQQQGGGNQNTEDKYLNEGKQPIVPDSYSCMHISN